MTSLAGQTVLVTGANRGMGREYIGQLLDRGVTKVYAAARDPRTIDATDPRVIPLRLDVTYAASVAEAGAAASDVSVLINNAGSLAEPRSSTPTHPSCARNWRRTCSVRSQWHRRSPIGLPNGPA